MWQDGLVGDIVKRDSGQVPFGVASGQPANELRLYHVHIISNGSAGEIKLYNGTSTSGELRYQLLGTASTGKDFDFGTNGALFEDGCYCDFVTDANIASVTFSYYGTATVSSSSSSSCRSSSSSSSSSSCRSSSSSSRSSSSSSLSSSSSSSSCRSSSSSSCSSSSSSSSISSSSSSCRSSSSSSSSVSSSSSSANP